MHNSTCITPTGFFNKVGNLCWYSKTFPFFQHDLPVDQVFSKSINTVYSWDDYSIHCSIIIHKALIWSIQEWFRRKPACSFWSLKLTCSLILLSSTLVNTLLGTERSVIPCQLSQFAVSPFFGIFTNRPHPQSCGISPSIHILSNRGCNISAVMSKSIFITSGIILSAPASFPLCNSFSAFLTSYHCWSFSVNSCICLILPLFRPFFIYLCIQGMIQDFWEVFLPTFQLFFSVCQEGAIFISNWSVSLYLLPWQNSCNGK